MPEPPLAPTKIILKRSRSRSRSRSQSAPPLLATAAALPRRLGRPSTAWRRHHVHHPQPRPRQPEIERVQHVPEELRPRSVTHNRYSHCAAPPDKPLHNSPKLPQVGNAPLQTQQSVPPPLGDSRTRSASRGNARPPGARLSRIAHRATHRQPFPAGTEREIPRASSRSSSAAFGRSTREHRQAAPASPINAPLKYIGRAYIGAFAFWLHSCATGMRDHRGGGLFFGIGSALRVAERRAI